MGAPNSLTPFPYFGIDTLSIIGIMYQYES